MINPGIILKFVFIPEKEIDKKTKAIRLSTYTEWASYKTLRNKVNNMETHAKEHFQMTIESSLCDLKKMNPKQY